MLFKKKDLFILTLILSCFLGKISAQTLAEKDIAYFKKYEDSLGAMQKQVFYGKQDTTRFKANIKFKALMEEVLLNQLSFYYPFDSLKDVSRIVSEDKKVRLITWNIYKNDGTQSYFGFVQAQHPKTKKYELYPLTDRSAGQKNPENYVGDNTKWFGMLYYTIIDCDGYYTLLGWDGNDKVSSRKFIDVLSFQKDGSPVFGKDIFKFPKKNPKRIMFEFNAQLSMSLRYHKDINTIIFDHLAPKESYLENQYQYYGPDFSYDAFIYKHGKWNYEEDVDARNGRSKTDNVKRDKDRKEKPVYVPK